MGDTKSNWDYFHIHFFFQQLQSSYGVLIHPELHSESYRALKFHQINEIIGKLTAALHAQMSNDIVEVRNKKGAIVFSNHLSPLPLLS